MAQANKGFSRAERVAEQIRRDLAELLSREVKDPRISMVSITAVELSPDYSHAKIFFTALQPAERRAEIIAGLQAAAGFLRREIGRRIRIHTTPQLHFHYDESIARGADLSQLIDKAAALSRQTPED
ncbi:MAG TPA: 30S ribosome-binding factor RbfA [Rhodocyclaceae bacterium]